MVTLTQDKLHQLLKQPDELSMDDLMALESAVKKYPFFQMGYTLLAKGFHTKAPGIAGDAIRLAAIHSPNRNMLRRLIDNEIDWDSFYVRKEVGPALGSEQINEEIRREAIAEKTLDELAWDWEETQPPLASDQSDIIESFIKNEPRITKLPTGQEGDEGFLEDLSERSTQLESYPVTETYAKILTIQRKYEKALEVYQGLIGKYPEKSSYFAARIVEVRNLMKS